MRDGEEVLVAERLAVDRKRPAVEPLGSIEVPLLLQHSRQAIECSGHGGMLVAECPAADREGFAIEILGGGVAPLRLQLPNIFQELSRGPRAVVLVISTTRACAGVPPR